MNEYRFGPYAKYVEVKTPFGEWGVPAGEILTFDDENRPVFTRAKPGTAEAETVDPYLQTDAAGNPLPPVVGEPAVKADKKPKPPKPPEAKPGDPGF